MTNVTDDRQTDHATEKCVAIGGVAFAGAILPDNSNNNNLEFKYMLRACIDCRCSALLGAIVENLYFTR